MSSFRRKFVKQPIPGTRSSPQTGQVITSSGNPSLDVILGGGLPIGSICLVEEDKFVTYSKVLAKYFMAEGVLSEQSLFLGSLDDNPRELINKLPQHCTMPVEDEHPEQAKNGLRIAWRYNDLPMVNSEKTSAKIGHNFNLMEFMDPKLLEFADTITWSDERIEDGCDGNDPSVGNDPSDDNDNEPDIKYSIKDILSIDMEVTTLDAISSRVLCSDDKMESNEDTTFDAACVMDCDNKIDVQNLKNNAILNPVSCLSDKFQANENKMDTDATYVTASSKEIDMANSKKNATPNPLLCLDGKSESNEDTTFDAACVMDCDNKIDLENLKNNAILNPVSCLGDKFEANENKMDTDATYVTASSKEIDMANSKKNATPNPLLYLDNKSESNEEKNVSIETKSVLSTPPSSKQEAKTQIFTNLKYTRLLEEVHDLLSSEQFDFNSFGMKRSLCRVCLTSLGSPQWYDENFGADLIKFLTILRAAVRSSVSVCFITMPMHLVAKYDDTLVSKIRNLVDYAIELESFAGSEKEANPAFKEYNGLFNLRKIAAINTLSAYVPETTDLAFKLKRKKFVIEKLHLPPDLQESSTTAKQDAKPSTISCGINQNPNSNSLDF